MNVPDRPVDRHGHRVYRGLAAAVAAELSTRTGYEARVTLLGHVQRGGTPTAHDRVHGVQAVPFHHPPAEHVQLLTDVEPAGDTGRDAGQAVCVMLSGQ